MNTNARLKKIEKELDKKSKQGVLYYPITFIDGTANINNIGVPADENGLPPPLLGGLSVVDRE